MKYTSSQPALRLFLGITVLLLATACGADSGPIRPTIGVAGTMSANQPVKALPTATTPAAETPTPAASAASDDGRLAPAGEPGVTYYAPFPVAVELDGNLDDWVGVPTVTMPAEAVLDKPVLTFAAAADEQYLYFMGNVVKPQPIVSGEHEQDYWNEDSVEFYVNGTGNLGLLAYSDGVAQLTIPALNVDRTGSEVVISGVNGPAVEAQVAARKTPTGYAVEVAVPLKNKVWDIQPAHGGGVGFQVHLNAATKRDRDVKLIWSTADKGDISYLNPSVFGQLIFYEIGQTDRPVFQPTSVPRP